MSYEYLNDKTFLYALDKTKIKIQYAKIFLLSFNSEKVIDEISGTFTSGNISVNGSAAVRRTINLTMAANYSNSDIENVDNEISINKKIKVFIGYKNPFSEYKEQYGDIIWFPCGVYIISTAAVSHSTSGWTISITGKDKMAMLDGTCGGTLPASVSFNEEYIYSDPEDPDSDVTIDIPTIYNIISEAVKHYGQEREENIFINDILDQEANWLVKYVGDKPIYFNDTYSSFSFVEDSDYTWEYTYNEDVGYKPTDLTYTGDLILAAGDTVVTLLDKIVSFLGNYEYFYDLDGHFIFQEKRNYQTINSPLLTLDNGITCGLGDYYAASAVKDAAHKKELALNNYTVTYSNRKYKDVFTDFSTVTSISRTPNFNNIKNDFIVWGKRETESGAEVDIRYHAAIDSRPTLNFALQYMWRNYSTDDGIEKTIQYIFNTTGVTPSYSSGEIELVGEPCTEWREELYRIALLDYIVANTDYDNSWSYYYEEILAEWRNLYDTTNEEWDETSHWNPAVFNDPKSLNYWLDIIDDGSYISRYSVSAIGRRTQVTNNDDLKYIKANMVEDVMFLFKSEFDSGKVKDNAGKVVDLNTKKAMYSSYGQKWFQIDPSFDDLFQVSSTGSSCYDEIKNLIYKYLYYNTQITISCMPRYYLEPNYLIRVKDSSNHLNDDFVITQMSLPLTYNGLMSITLSQATMRE